jgi:hypothetical protein
MSFHFGTLTEKNIDEVAEKLRKLLLGKKFSIATVNWVKSNPRLELETDCELNTQWTDGSTEKIRVRADSRKWLGFSAGGYFWTFSAAPTDVHDFGNREFPYFVFTYGAVRIEQRSPSGDLHYYMFKVQNG